MGGKRGNRPVRKSVRQNLRERFTADTKRQVAKKQYGVILLVVAMGLGAIAALMFMAKPSGATLVFPVVAAVFAVGFLLAGLVFSYLGRNDTAWSYRLDDAPKAAKSNRGGSRAKAAKRDRSANPGQSASQGE